MPHFPFLIRIFRNGLKPLSQAVGRQWKPYIAPDLCDCSLKNPGATGGFSNS